MKPILTFALVLTLLPGSLFAQEKQAPAATAAANPPVSPATAPAAAAELHDPFFGAGGDYEREARRKLAQAALNRCRILARGASVDGEAAVLISLAEGRNSLLKVGDSLTLDAEGALIDYEIVAVTRQMVKFELEDGSSLILR